MINNKGQAFTEALFILPLMVLMIVSIIWFARILLTWQQLVSAARYGTDMIANTTLSVEDIKKDIENYLTNQKIDGRRLDIEKIKEIKIVINDCPRIDINVTNLINIFANIDSLINGLFVPSADVSSVSITYSYDVPRFFNLIGMEELKINTKSSVLSGSGCKNSIHKRSEK